jgi:Zn-dependent membrane protease YugP
MILAAGTIVLLVLVFGPHIWVRHVLARYATPIEQLPGTGGELALHLLRKLKLKDVRVEVSTPGNDHYDPGHKSVNLSPEVYNGKSLTAITISAHEVGHALQHKLMYKPLLWRWRMASLVAWSEKFASIVLLAFPFIILITHLPHIGIMMMLTGLGIMLLPVLFHLITLPVELDASFRRALPILITGRYIPESAVPIANRILFAAALTYLSASLASILNFYRWVAILRR